MKMRSGLPIHTGLPGTARRTRPSTRHSVVTIALHWTSVLAILVAAGAALWRDWTEFDRLRAPLMLIHQQAGLFVIVALALRLSLRLAYGFADHAGPMPWLLHWAARLSHLALYSVLLVLPLLGLAVCAASAMDVRLFGLFRIPAIVADDPDFAATLSDCHVWAAWALLGMVSAHASAALYHHWIRRDGVLSAMLPWVRRRPPLVQAAPEGQIELGGRPDTPALNEAS